MWRTGMLQSVGSQRVRHNLAAEQQQKIFLSRCCSGKESICQCKTHGFHPWVGKIPWRRKWQPTPVFLLRESHGQRSLVTYSPWGRKELGMTERVTHTHKQKPGEKLSSELRFHSWKQQMEGFHQVCLFCSCVFPHPDMPQSLGFQAPFSLQPLQNEGSASCSRETFFIWVSASRGQGWV